MKTKLICSILIASVMLLPSCDRSVLYASDYPDILSVNDGKKLPDLSENDQLNQEEVSDCQHFAAGYRSTTDSHRLYCSECNQPLDEPEPHILKDYLLQSCTVLDSKQIRTYSKSCSVCNASVEFLLSANFYGEYMGE